MGEWKALSFYNDKINTVKFASKMFLSRELLLSCFDLALVDIHFLVRSFFYLFYSPHCVIGRRKNIDSWATVPDISHLFRQGILYFYQSQWSYWTNLVPRILSLPGCYWTYGNGTYKSVVNDLERQLNTLSNWIAAVWFEIRPTSALFREAFQKLSSNRQNSVENAGCVFFRAMTSR